MKLSENSVRDHEAVIFSCFMPGENLQEHRLANHSLILVCEGEIDIIDNNRNLTVSKGEYVFLQRDCQIRIHKHSVGDIPYSAMSIRFKRPALRNYFRQINADTLPKNVARFDLAAIKIAGIIAAFHPAFGRSPRGERLERNCISERQRIFNRINL